MLLVGLDNVRPVDGDDASKTSTGCFSATDSYARAASLADTREISIKRLSNTGTGMAAEAESAGDKMLAKAISGSDRKNVIGILSVGGIYEATVGDWRCFT